jgi:cytochrome c
VTPARRLTTALALAFAPLGAGAATLGDPVRGEAEVWPICAACHQIGPGAENRTGPQLNAIFGRPAGSVPGFAYSEGLLREGANGLVWTLEPLDAWLENPRFLVSHSHMSFAGLPDPRDRADILAFLRTHGPSPADIPESEPTATAHAPEIDVPDIAGDADYGAYLASECVTCHRADGTAEGIPSITRWNPRDFAAALHAYKRQLRPHPVMRMIAGRLSDEEIAALAAYFAGLDG